MLLLESIRILDGGGGGSGSSNKVRRRSPVADEDHDTASTYSQSLLIPGIPDDIALNCLALARRSDHPTLACLNARFNSLIGSDYLYELRRGMGVVENWVFMVYNLGVWEAFDPGENRWLRLPRIPCDDCFANADKESLTVGHRLLVFGREIWDFAVWSYSGPRHGWARCRSMHRPRCLFACAATGVIAIVAGGTDMRGTVLRSAELYNSETGTWEVLPDMKSPRKLCAGFFMNGKFYVVGGMSGPKTQLACGEEYNPRTRSWRTIDGMYPTAGKAAGAPPLVAVVDDKLYAVEHETNMVKCYDVDNNMWTVIGRLPVRADISNGWGLAFKAYGKELLVVGGQRGPEGESIVLSSWRPGGGAPDWKRIGVKERAGVFIYNCAVMGC